MILKFLGCFGAFWVDSMFAIPSRFEGNASRLLELKDFSCSGYLYIVHFPFLLPGTFCFRFTILIVFPFAYSSGTVDLPVLFYPYFMFRKLFFLYFSLQLVELLSRASCIFFYGSLVNVFRV